MSQIESVLRTFPWFVALHTFFVACASSPQTAVPPTATPAPCSPNDPSWGCQSARQAQPPVFLPPTGGSPVSWPPISGIPAQPVQTAAGTAPGGPGNAAGTPTTIGSTPNQPSPSLNTPQPSDDPLGRGDTDFMRKRVESIVAELIAALEPSLRSRVQNLPIVFDPSRTEVNAFATCSRGQKAAIAVTDGMLVLTGNVAQLRATDDVFGTHLLANYTAYVAQNAQAGQPILLPATYLPSAEQAHSTAKVSRELHLFDEMIGFIFAHEMAHHYLNHLPCTSVLPLDASELGVMLTDAVPGFNQPNETAADMAGVRNVLLAGKRRTSDPLTESGAIAQLTFFEALDSARPIDVFSFERTHPPPSLRVPVVQTAAQAFRATGGITLPW